MRRTAEPLALPKLEALEWPRLERLRSELDELLAAHRPRLAKPVRLRARFAAEDQAARAAAIATARNGDGEGISLRLTPASRRATEIDVAEEIAAAARAEIESFADSAIRELAEHWPEVEAARESAAASDLGSVEALARDAHRLQALYETKIAPALAAGVS